MKLKKRLDRNKVKNQPDRPEEPKREAEADQKVPIRATRSEAFENPLALTNSVSGIFGKRGCGKTYLSQKLVDKFDRVIVYDPRSQVNIFPTVVNDLDGFVSEVMKNTKKFRITYRPKFPKEDFEQLNFMIKETPFSKTMYLVDEVSMMVDPYNIPDNFQHLIRFGRHNQLAVMITAQRPADVNRDLTAQCTELFIFYQHEPRDITYFSGFLGEHTRKLNTLKERTCLFTDFKDFKVIDNDLKSVRE